ncbi:hypothetical protein [Cellulomonas sp. HZM]|uniref:hypothetical protein n=1 Tax=Cellulomonas sp. HZM TaxID=1454010 RepID=UPI000493B179|nr:hypothetical protein [Cellulomonas sp. HZM]
MAYDDDGVDDLDPEVHRTMMISRVVLALIVVGALVAGVIAVVNRHDAPEPVAQATSAAASRDQMQAVLDATAASIAPSVQLTPQSQTDAPGQSCKIVWNPDGTTYWLRGYEGPVAADPQAVVAQVRDDWRDQGFSVFTRTQGDTTTVRGQWPAGGLVAFSTSPSGSLLFGAGACMPH